MQQKYSRRELRALAFASDRLADTFNAKAVTCSQWHLATLLFMKRQGQRRKGSPCRALLSARRDRGIRSGVHAVSDSSSSARALFSTHLTGSLTRIRCRT
jgi:hypothetical protein